ncbi:MAG: phosphatidate cytidylyltransferase [Chlorobi bacterium]|nr:phosphatidate cytidylyltransferase [Chlorobiota bacterium]
MLKHNLLKRALSALIFVIVLLGGILINEYLYVVVFLLITLVALSEAYHLFEKTGNKPQKYYGLFVGLTVWLLTFFVAREDIPPVSYFIAIFLIIFLFIFEIYQDREDYFLSIAFTVFGIVYVVIPMATLNFIAFSGINKGVFTHKYLLALFVILWINDTGAYLIGSKFGKTKLFERISPNKTWEGTIGGAIFAFVAAYIISLYFKSLTLPEWIIFAVVTVVFGVYGDLTESWLKRRAGIKDSGTIMPGHGGLLDRFDSTLFAAPMIFLYLKIIEYFFL